MNFALVRAGQPFFNKLMKDSLVIRRRRVPAPGAWGVKTDQRRLYAPRLIQILAVQRHTVCANAKTLMVSEPRLADGVPTG